MIEDPHHQMWTAPDEVSDTPVSQQRETPPILWADIVRTMITGALFPHDQPCAMTQDICLV